jgi:hypothetical protein
MLIFSTFTVKQLRIIGCISLLLSVGSFVLAFGPFDPKMTLGETGAWVFNGILALGLGCYFLSEAFKLKREINEWNKAEEKWRIIAPEVLLRSMPPRQFLKK